MPMFSWTGNPYSDQNLAVRHTAEAAQRRWLTIRDFSEVLSFKICSMRN